MEKNCGKKVKVDSIDAYTEHLEEQNDDGEERIKALKSIASGSSRFLTKYDPEKGGTQELENVSEYESAAIAADGKGSTNYGSFLCNLCQWPCL